MKTLVNKMKNKKGFTLMEMLIVVAIMVILVAVSIPVFTSKLDQAKEATDAANMRAAKSVMLTAYMSGEVTDGGEYDCNTTAGKISTYYDAENGKLSKTEPDNDEYGQGSTYNSVDTEDKCIKMTLDTATSVIEIKWE